MVDAVLLEWEGVLADTWSARRDALRVALAAEGIAHRVADHDDQLRGVAVPVAVRVVLRHLGIVDPVLAELLALRATRTFAQALATGLVVDPAAVAFVRRVHPRHRIAIVTRATRDETALVLRLAGLGDAVSTMTCADDVEGDAPSVHAYARALGQLGRVRPLEARAAVAVVDGLPSIRAARTAGVRVLVVGAPAHEAMDADTAVASLDGMDPAGLARGNLVPHAARGRGPR